MMVLAPPPAGTPATSSFNQFAAAYGGGMPAAGGGAYAATPGQQQLYVFMGMKNHRPTGMDPSGDPFFEHNYKSTDYIKGKQLTAEEVLARFERMKPEKQMEMLRLLAIGGFTGSTIPLDKVDEFVKGASLDDAIAAYSELLKTSADYWMNSGLAVTPDEVLKSRVGYRMKAAGLKWSGDLSSLGSKDLASSLKVDHSPKTVTATSKSIDFLNPADAKYLVRSTLQQELGRDPTQAEYEDFLAAIHAAERQDPTTEKTTTKYVYNDATQQYDIGNQTHTTHQGIGATGLEQLAQNRAEQQPGWAEWQAMGTYAPALFQALGAAVPGA